MEKFSVVEWLFLCALTLLSPSHSPSDKGQDTQGDPQCEDEQVEDRDVGDADAAVIQEDDQRAAHQQEAYDDSDPEGFHLRLPSRHFPICLSLQQFSSALHTHAEVQPSIAHQSDDPGADREDKGLDRKSVV